jgi:dUTP pyrophosphatase
MSGGAPGRGGGVLGRDALLARLGADPPLVRGLADPMRQVQPHGVDLRLESVWRFASAGLVGRDPASIPPSTHPSLGQAGWEPARPDRALPEREALPFDDQGALHLPPGAYLVRFEEIVHLPLDLMALARPRSTLLRCGAALHTAVWDAGYQGRSEALLIVANPHGLRLERGARICQMIFLPLDAAGASYAGTYQGENV